MQNVCSDDELSTLLQSNPAVLLLYGGASCGVCQAIKPPQLERLSSEQFPKLITATLIARHQPVRCVRLSIFSLPVVQLWFEGGQRFAEFARVFSIGEVRAALERPYRVIFQG